MKGCCLRCPAVALAFLLAISSAAAGQTGANVLLLVNDTSADSVRVADYYARARGVRAAAGDASRGRV